MGKANGQSPISNVVRMVACVSLLAFTLIAPGTPAAASPTGIDGCFFRDLNGSSVQGDAQNTSVNDETAFVSAPITLVLTSGGVTVATTTTDPVTGCFDFAGLAPGNYQIEATFPSEYYSSAPGTDNAFTPGPPPTTAGDLFTADYSFTYASGDDLSITGAVSGLPELRLGYFITPTGDPMIETGTAPFDTEGTCPTLTPGDDCGTYDNVIRTNDATTIGYTVTVDNVPDGSTNPLNDVVLEQTITPNPGAVVEVPSLHPNCLTTGVNPTSSIVVDPVTGVITVTCNLGPKDNGTSIIPTYIRTDGASENGSSFTVEARVYSGTDRAQVDERSILEEEEIFVSGSPKFDITKGNDSTNPYNRVVYLQTTERLNPNTGVSEYGVNYSWDVSVLYDGDAKGQTALVDPITFSDKISADFTGWDLVSCHNTPYPSGSGLPDDSAGPQDWGDRGTWSCVEDYANNEIDVTVTGVDTDGDPVPTQGNNGTSLAAGPYVAFGGRIVIWYPLSEFYQRIDPSWEYGDDPIEGDYPLVNEITNFDPTDATGQSNFGDGTEPTGNNDRQISVPIKERGGFSKHLGSYEWADNIIPDGSLTGSPGVWPCGSSSIAAGSLMSGQTQACLQGDAPVQPGEKAHFWYWMRNDGTTPWPAESAELCDAFDNSTMSLTTWTGGEPLYIRGSFPANAYIIEYATAGFNDDTSANDWTNQVAAVQTCTAPNNDWSTDPLSFDTDPTTSLEKVGMIRVRLDPTVVAEVLPSQYFQVSFPVEIRDIYNGGPRDGESIDVGNILANNANRKYGSVDYSTTHFGAEDYVNSAWGDRLILNRHQVRINKTTSIDPLSPTDDDLINVQGAETVVWWLQPAVTAVTSGAPATGVTITDTLPAGVSFDSYCQASQAYPDANVVLDSVTVNPDGTTTIVFDLGTRPTNEPIGPIPLCTTIDNFLDPGTDLINHVTIESDSDVSPESAREDERTVTVVASGELQLFKEVDAPLELQLDTQEFTMGWRNLSTDFDFAPPDIIDVFGYNGDAVNPLNQRTEFDSNYSGDYFLTGWMAQPTTLLDGGGTEVTGGTWYYSADDPNTIPHDADAPANALSGGTVTWCTQAELTTAAAPCDFTLSDATAVRFVQSDILAAQSSVVVSFEMQAGTVTNPNEPADRYVNRFAARTDSVDDLVRSNEVLVQVLSLNLGDLVFLDTDVDGKFTTGVDQPVVGTVVELWTDTGGGVMAFVDDTTTDSNGRYIFEELIEGDYEIRIPDAELSGGTLDTWTQTILPTPANDDANEDVDQQGYDSTNGYTTSGIVTLNADTTIDPPLGLEPTGENIFNLGNPITFDNLSNLTVDLGFRGDPDVQIIKEVCDPSIGGCDLSTDPLDASDGWVETVTTQFTDDVVWRISVINIGFEMLTNVVVDDDIEDACDRDAAALGDINVGDHVSWICTTSTVVTDITNTADVTAEGIGSGIEVDDTNDADSVTPTSDPNLEITKFVNGDDAQTAPGVVLEEGDPVTFTYQVSTGTGNMPLSDVEITDDNGTPLDATDDFTATYVSGDTDGDDRLDPGETWNYEATGFVAAADQYSNIGTVTGQPVAPGLEELSATDPANYYGVTSGIELTKFVNTEDANSAPGPLIAAGDDAVFTYELVNTGNWEVTVGDLVDDAGTASDLTDDWVATLVGGDSDDDGLLDPNETWLYTYTATATAGPYSNNASVTAEDIFDNELSDDDPANYYGSEPGIDVDKVTNGDDGLLIEAGSDITWTYTVTNTGNVPLANINVEDNQEGTATYISGDTNNDNLLDLNETWTFEIDGTATEGTYTNEGTATGTAPETTDEEGNPVEGEEVNANDPSNYYGSEPGIDVDKVTNGDDGLLIEAGSDITWTYTVTNTGNVPLANINVEDNQEGTATYISGDTNNDNLLDLNETWTFEIDGTATEGTYTNEGTATGTAPETTDEEGNPVEGEEVNANDPSNYYGVTVGIDITKYVQGEDANDAPGPLIDADGTAAFTYEVTNTGNSPLTIDSIVDDAGTPLDLSDDFVPTFVSGDTNDDGLLDPDETWSYEMDRTVVEGAYSNNVVVDATGPSTVDENGDPVEGEEVTDDDDANYYGTEPAIAIVKVTNGDDDVFIPNGDLVTWTYTVTNTGNVPLANINVEDNQEGTATYISGDTNNDNLLDLNETWTFEIDGTATEGTYTNEGTATGTAPETTDEEGNPVEGEEVNANDPSNYYGSEPGIDVVKTTNLVDSDSETGPHVRVGDPITWTYTVTNTGNVPLANINVEDNQEGTATYISGDTNNDNLLDLNETWTFEIDGTATEGQYENNAIASGTPPTVNNPDGTTTEPDPVTDDDPDFYFGSEPGIGIVKVTNGSDDEVGPGQFIVAGAPIVWTYTVTNEGNVALTDVAVTDDNGTPSDPSDDLIAVYVSGDLNDDGLLDVDEIWVFEATGVATAGDYHNVAEVEGTPPEETNPEGDPTTPPPVSDTDDGFYYGAGPAISIVKYVNDDDANEAPGIFVLTGEEVAWTYVVTNIGDTVLDNVAVSDDQGVVVTCPLDLLQIGEAMTCTGEPADATLGQYTNIGSVTGDPVQPDGEGGYTPVLDPETLEPVSPVTDEDAANYFGSEPAVNLVKSVCGVEPSDCDPTVDNRWVDSTDIELGGSAMFRIAVTNTGNVTLTNVVVNDPIAPGCDATRPSLAVGETWLVTCTLTDITEAFVNTASVEASTPVGLPPTTDSTVDPDATMSTNESDTASVVLTTSLKKDSTLTALALTGTSTRTMAWAAVAMIIVGAVLLRRRKRFAYNKGS